MRQQSHASRVPSLSVSLAIARGRSIHIGADSSVCRRLQRYDRKEPAASHGASAPAVRWHRPLAGQIKTLRLVKRAGNWYAVFSCITETQPLESTGRDVGIDVGVASLLTNSAGERVDNPRWYRTEQRKLRVLQRRLARRKKGGSNRRKAILALQRQHERIANRRRDFLNKLIHGFITRYDRIALEDLRITNMVRNPHLAKSILDAGWGYLTQHLMSKAASAGRLVVLVDPRNTSQNCSGCGRLVPKI